MTAAVLAVAPLVVVSAGVVTLITIGLVFIGWRYGGPNARYLEWDPVAEEQGRRAQDSVDLAEMLALHNAARVRNGLEPVTLDEYAEAVHRPPGPA
jgi:uncharacterized protein YkwD